MGKIIRKSFEKHENLELQKNFPFIRKNIKNKYDIWKFKKRYNSNANYLPYKYLKWDILNRFRGHYII